MRDHATIGDGAGKNRTRRRRYLVPKLRVNAVRGDDEIAFRDGSVRERYPCDVSDLLAADAAMASVHHVHAAERRPGFRQDRRDAFRMWRSSRRSPSPAPVQWALRRDESIESRSDPGSALSRPTVQGRPSVAGARCSASGTRPRRPRRDSEPAHRPTPESREQSARSQRTSRRFRRQRPQPSAASHSSCFPRNAACDRVQVVSSHGAEQCRHLNAPIDGTAFRRKFGCAQYSAVARSSLVERSWLALCLAGLQGFETRRGPMAIPTAP